MTLRIWGHLGHEVGERLQAHRLREMVGWPRSTLLAREQLPTTRSPPLKSVGSVEAHGRCRP